jgi:peptidoglycan hydrolase-like protein with peptidoglycan-binding domain
MKRIASNPLSTRLKMRFSTQHNRKTHPRARSRLSWVWRGFWGCLGAIAVMGTVHAQQLGDRGVEVTRVQMRLQVLGYSQVQPTGVYDPVTQQAIQDFQLTHGLEADGIVGSQTRSLLFDNGNPGFVPIANPNPVSSMAVFPPEGNVNPPDNAIAQNFYDVDPFFNQNQGRFFNNRPTLQIGDEGSTVRYLQSLLRNQGYFIDVDGVFGPQTQDRVERFQTSRGLSPDGVVGLQTWAALEGNTSPSPRPPQASNPRYVVVVPGDNNVLRQLNQEYRNDASLRSDFSLRRNRLGLYVEAGRFASREVAESRSYLLRSQGFDARVIYD